MSRHYGKKPEPAVIVPVEPIVDTPVDDGDDNDVQVDDGEEAENDS